MFSMGGGQTEIPALGYITSSNIHIFENMSNEYFYGSCTIKFGNHITFVTIYFKHLRVSDGFGHIIYAFQ